MRAGVTLFAAAEGGAAIGAITSGGFSPSLEAPVAMGYLPSDIDTGATVWGEIRGRREPVRVVPLPFHKTTYKR